MQNEFNDKAQKIVNEDEFRRRRFLLEQEQFTLKEKFFQIPNDLYNAFLWVRRGVSEAIDQIRGREKAEGDYYFDKLSHYDKYGHARFGTTYMDRAVLEGDLAYFEKHGLSKSFQEKSARIARQAFDQSRDFSVLLKIGQLEKFNASPGL